MVVSSVIEFTSLIDEGHNVIDFAVVVFTKTSGQEDHLSNTRPVLLSNILRIMTLRRTKRTEKRFKAGLPWTEDEVAHFIELYPTNSNKDLVVRFGRGACHICR